MLAVGAVAEVAVDGQHGPGDVHDLVAREEAEHIGEARVGLVVAVAAAEATAHREIVADELAALDDGDVAEVVGEDVHVVRRRDDEGGLELARQVGLAVERIGEGGVFRRVEVELDVVDPDGVVGRGLGREGVHHQQAVGEDLGAGLRRRGRGRDSDVAVHVAAGGEGGKHGLVDPLDDRAEAGLHDAVELDALTRGDAQGVVAVLGGEVVEGDPLLRRHDAARDAAADHDQPLLAGLAEVPVVLLIDAVKLDELLVILGELLHGRVGQGGRDVAGQRGDTLLQDFVLGNGCGRFIGHD